MVEQTPERSARIRELNDELRLWLTDDDLLLSFGIQELPGEMKKRVIFGVREYDGFTDQNDPRGEHTSGSFEIEGYQVVWQIDYYDRASHKMFESDDPADPEKTRRYLVIFLKEEQGDLHRD